MSGYLEFLMKDVIVPSVLKSLCSNPLTPLHKNVNILKTVLDFICTDFYQNKGGGGEDSVPLLHVVNKQFSLYRLPTES